MAREIFPFYGDNKVYRQMRRAECPCCVDKAETDATTAGEQANALYDQMQPLTVGSQEREALLNVWRDAYARHKEAESMTLYYLPTAGHA